MKISLLSICLGGLALAQTPGPGKVGIIHIQNAIVASRDGQAALSALQGKFDPKRKEFESKQNEIAALQQEFSKGSNTMAEERKAQLSRQIDQRTKALNRETEDAQAEYEQDQGRILNDVGQRVMVVVEKYARDNGFTLILDVSSQQTPVLFAANGYDITKEIVELYDKNSPASAAPAKPATLVQPKPATGTPMAPPATKKAPGTIK